MHQRCVDVRLDRCTIDTPRSLAAPATRERREGKLSERRYAVGTGEAGDEAVVLSETSFNRADKPRYEQEMAESQERSPGIAAKSSSPKERVSLLHFTRVHLSRSNWRSYKATTFAPLSLPCSLLLEHRPPHAPAPPRLSDSASSCRSSRTVTRLTSERAQYR